MLRITQLTSAKSAGQYFSRSDYYDAEQLKGKWYGKAATQLGLRGEVSQSDFEQVLNNQFPHDASKSITPRTRFDRRPGWDFTFTVSKSASIVYAITGDPKILEALQTSVEATLSEMEQDVLTRVHNDNRMTTERTGNMLFATFLHKEARPVDGFPDVSLHIHAVAPNMTYQNGQFKAADIHLIKQDAPYYQARFESRFAHAMRELGWGVVRNGKHYEIQGVSREIIERFSARTMQIEAEAKRRNITNAKQKAALGAKTREAKSQGIRPDALPFAWRMKLSQQETNTILRDSRQAPVTVSQTEPAHLALRHAARHHFERESVVRVRDLKVTALQHAYGLAPPEVVDQVFDRLDLVQRGSHEHHRATTRVIVDEERQILLLARQGRNSIAPVNPDYRIQQDFLSQEQREAVENLVSSSDAVQVLIGRAGVGKSTIAEELRKATADKGMPLVMVAPTSKAVEVLKKDGHNAISLAQLLVDQRQQEAASNGFVFLDEAGLVGSEDMLKFLNLASSIGARVCLSGDDRQHSAIGRGRVLALLEAEAGIKPVEIQTIRRQAGTFREIVEDFSRHEITKGFSGLETLGWIHESPGDERFRQIADRFADATTNSEKALVIAPTHAEREKVGQAIRQELKERQLVGQDDHLLKTLSAKGWTTAQKQDGSNYRRGDVVEFHRKAPGFDAGERATVVKSSGDSVFVASIGGQKPLPLTSAKSFDVFEPNERPFSVGETIRITRNRRARNGEPRLTNGSVFIIQGFHNDGRIDLGRGKSITADFGHIDSAAVTSFASQGTTVDRCFLSLGTDSFPAVSPEQAYVSISRGRKSAEIFTDDRAEMLKAASKSREKEHALDLLREEVQPAQPRTLSLLRQQVERMRNLGQLVRGYAYKGIRPVQEWLTQRREPAMQSIQKG